MRLPTTGQQAILQSEQEDHDRYFPTKDNLRIRKHQLVFMDLKISNCSKCSGISNQN